MKQTLCDHCGTAINHTHWQIVNQSKWEITTVEYAWLKDNLDFCSPICMRDWFLARYPVTQEEHKTTRLGPMP